MLNLTLYKRGLKEIWKMLLIFAAIITMYFAVIIPMFDPEIGSILEQFAQAMPEFMTLFGMVLKESTMLGFISAYLYGFIMLAVPMVFSILCSNMLMSRHIDRGSMVYLLSAPVKRSSVAFTQMKVIVTGIFALVVYSTVLGIVLCESVFPGQLEIGKFLLLNAGALSLHLFVAGISFLCSCVFNEAKHSTWFGAGIPTVAFILRMIANNGGTAENAKYVTFFSLYSPEKISTLDGGAIAGIIVLFAGGIALFFAAIALFSKKDLHI